MTKKIVKIIAVDEDGNEQEIRLNQKQEFDSSWPFPRTVPPLVFKKNACPVCNLDMNTPMGYCCNNPKCPTGMVRTSC